MTEKNAVSPESPFTLDGQNRHRDGRRTRDWQGHRAPAGVGGRQCARVRFGSRGVAGDAGLRRAIPRRVALICGI